MDLETGVLIFSSGSYLFSVLFYHLGNPKSDPDFLFAREVRLIVKTISQMAFAAVADKWLETIEPEVKLSTQVRYINLLNSYLLPEFGELPVSEITRTQVTAYRLKLLKVGGEHGTGLSPRTLSATLSLLRRILHYARQEMGYPTQDIQHIAHKQIQKPLRVFSPAEQQKILQYLATDLSLIDFGILIAIYMGLRVGEICALKWKNISFDDWNLHVNQTMQRIQTFNAESKTKVIITSPKSICSIRTIPIPVTLQPVFLEKRRNDDCFVLTGRSDKYIEPRTMENRFKRVLKICKIEDATFHACRHTFATRCVELGFDIKSLSEILGHATVNITMNRYVHPSMEFKRKYMDSLPEFKQEKKNNKPSTYKPNLINAKGDDYSKITF